jgi:type I thyroxine 5'-deiodinase
MDANEKENICYPQPHSTQQRAAIARDFLKRFDYPIPLVVDPIENPAEQVYAAWPERLYVVDPHGRIVYKGKTGPFGFHPEEVDAWLAAHDGPVHHTDRSVQSTRSRRARVSRPWARRPWHAR